LKTTGIDYRCDMFKSLLFYIPVVGTVTDTSRIAVKSSCTDK